MRLTSSPALEARPGVGGGFRAPSERRQIARMAQAVRVPSLKMISWRWPGLEWGRPLGKDRQSNV